MGLERHEGESILAKLQAYLNWKAELINTEKSHETAMTHLSNL